jgi:molybdopterin-containing oxidoreductase family iron-sulfur binding subunit
LAGLLNANAVDTLVIVGANPVYDAPADLTWPETQRKAKTVLRLGYAEDETGVLCDYHFPLAHYLESWGDARSHDGTLLSIQPLIEPLFGGLTEIEVLARIGALEQVRAYDIVRETFRGLGTPAFEEDWKRFLHNGFWTRTSTAAAPVQINYAAVAAAIKVAPAPAPSREQIEVVFLRDARLDDGRWNNNGWLQEMPDPVTKVVWENVVLMSKKTADELGVFKRDNQIGQVETPRVRIELGGRSIEGPVWVQPGMADYTVALPLGYGRTLTGRVGRGSGFSAYLLRTSAAPFVASGGKAALTGAFSEVACTQSHWALEGRPVIREAHLEDFRKHPDFTKRMDLEQPHNGGPLYPNPLDQARQHSLHDWGMAIDLATCVGCSACVLACQSENNVPIVGKRLVGRSREMHWLRIDRYYSGPVEDPQAVNQPMMCQHCEAAPCESVCPVNATVHDHEGLNLMVYNRCVGTRYCSNNCPYKVRRFNYFDYHKRPLARLFESPLTSATDGEWEAKRWAKNPDRPSRPQDEFDLLKLLRNPDVSVRMRGVMEKCTFCLQRIEGAKIARKVRARDSGDVVVPDGTFTTACAQACPTEAIVFGNLKDPDSHVSRLKQQERNYSVLDFLHTKPRLTYLARIRNPNPDMPDYAAMPASLREYSAKSGSPFEAHGGGAHEAPATGHGTAKGQEH